MSQTELSSPREWARRNWIWIATIAVVAAGAVLRVRQYLAGRSLWLDEAWLALNINGRSYEELLEPLDYSQGAPLGYLMVVKFLTNMIGQGEYTLRLFSLLAGLLALVIFPFVARNYLTPGKALWAVILFSFANPLIYYASEVKQYSVDILATVLCLGIFLFMLERALRIIDIIWLSALGSTLVWLSHPSIFLLAAAGCIIVFICLRERNLQKLGLVLIVGLLWSASFLLSMFISLESLTQNQILLQFWEDGFMPSMTQPIQVFEWLLRKTLVMFDEVLGIPLTGLAFAFSLLGAFSLARRDRARFFGLALPILFLLAASYLQRYPFSTRLILFLAPILMLMMAEGIGEMLSLPESRTLKIASWLVVFLLLFQPIKQTLDYARNPQLGEDIVPVIEYTHQNWMDGDAVYVYYSSYPAFTFYLPLFPFPEESIIKGVNEREDWIEYLNQMDILSTEHERIWLIFSHVYDGNGANEELLIVRYLEWIGGERMAESQAIGASAYLFEFPSGNDLEISE